MPPCISGSTQAPYQSLCINAEIEADLFGLAAKGLCENGFSIQPNLLPTALADLLVRHIVSSDAPNYQPAGIGRATTQQQSASIRRDKTAWTNQHGSEEDAEWHSWSEKLRSNINRLLMLGLTPIESHYARYEKGDFYRKHVDAFHGKSNRRVSLVAFLNPYWEAESKGQLVLYTGAEQNIPIRVDPVLGTVVLFMSSEIPHEVLPTACTRNSIAGWYS